MLDKGITDRLEKGVCDALSGLRSIAVEINHLTGRPSAFLPSAGTYNLVQGTCDRGVSVPYTLQCSLPTLNLSSGGRSRRAAWASGAGGSSGGSRW